MTTRSSCNRKVQHLNGKNEDGRKSSHRRHPIIEIGSRFLQGDSGSGYCKKSDRC
jgi:hypothetical protein